MKQKTNNKKKNIPEGYGGEIYSGGCNKSDIVEGW